MARTKLQVTLRLPGKIQGKLKAVGRVGKGVGRRKPLTGHGGIQGGGLETRSIYHERNLRQKKRWGAASMTRL